MKEWVGGRLVWVEPTASSVVARLNLANGIWDLNEINDYIYDGLWPNALSVQPLYVANGYLSVLRTDDINEAEFPNAALANGFLSALRLNPLTAAELSPKISIANGFLSVLRVGDTIPDSEFPNAALANGYLSTLHTNTIPNSEFPNAALANGYLSTLHTDTI
jgi:hypothetical protein